MPTATLTANPTSGQEPLQVEFTASAQPAGGATIASYHIAYGDGDSGTGASQTHTYQNSSPTPYTAVLTVTDSNGCQNTAQQNITVSDNTVTLRQGLNEYTGATDSWLCACNSGTGNYGTADYLVVVDNHSTVVRFAIFAAEDGPVPDNATIVSATLSLYKFSGPDAVMKASRLKKNWNESEVTWNVAANGTSWQTAGALGATDVEATADGQASVGNNGTSCSGQDGGSVCWLNIDVTSGVQAFRNGTPNYGWRIAQVSSSLPGNHKNFNSRENNGFESLRPRLTINYTVGP